MKLRRLLGQLLTPLLFTTLMAPPLAAEGERAGDFDYYVMALSWSSAWCKEVGDRRRDPQCEAGRGLSFVLHGLWPQYEQGWPSYCRSAERDPSRRETAAMAAVMGGSGYAFYQWKKHGRCSGLSAAAYFDTARQAYEKVVIPPVFSQLKQRLSVPAEVVEAAFLESNPGLQRDQITVTCKAGLIQEVRLCLGKDLQPRRCGADSIKDCRLSDAILEPLR